MGRDWTHSTRQMVDAEERRGCAGHQSAAEACQPSSLVRQPCHLRQGDVLAVETSRALAGELAGRLKVAEGGCVWLGSLPACSQPLPVPPEIRRSPAAHSPQPTAPQPHSRPSPLAPTCLPVPTADGPLPTANCPLPTAQSAYGLVAVSHKVAAYRDAEPESSSPHEPPHQPISKHSCRPVLAINITRLLLDSCLCLLASAVLASFLRVLAPES